METLELSPLIERKIGTGPGSYLENPPRGPGYEFSPSAAQGHGFERIHESVEKRIGHPHFNAKVMNIPGAGKLGGIRRMLPAVTRWAVLPVISAESVRLTVMDVMPRIIAL